MWEEGFRVVSGEGVPGILIFLSSSVRGRLRRSYTSTGCLSTSSGNPLSVDHRGADTRQRCVFVDLPVYRGRVEGDSSGIED